MLTNLLAWSLAIASLGLYLSGFFLPELYRKFDLAASGAGLFFALTLWIYGDRVNGGLLLGTTAGVVLILWFGWQTFQYRWQLTQPQERTDTQKARVLWQRAQELLPEGTLTQLKDRLQGLVSRTVAKDKDKRIPPVPPTASSAEPPLDTSPNIKEDLWGDGQAGSTPDLAAAATPVETVPPVETSTPVSEPELPQSTATPEIESIVAEAPENPPVSIAHDDDSSANLELADQIAEAPTSAADLIGDIPESSDEDSSTTTIENPEHSPSSTDSFDTSGDEQWPPPGTNV